MALDAKAEALAYPRSNGNNKNKYNGKCKSEIRRVFASLRITEGSGNEHLPE